MDRTLWPSVVLLFLLTILFEITAFDLSVQDWFYDFHVGRWLIDANSALPRMFFYTGPKALLWIFAIGVLGCCTAPPRWREKLPFRGVRRPDLWIVLATLATAPALVGAAKATTHVFTPNEIRRYGGFAPYVKVMEAYPADDRPKRRGRGFPAGHASGGFALLSLAGLARGRRGRLAGIAIGLTYGGAMGVYQMLKGAHYLSHTVITALLCWIVFLAYRRLFKAA